MDKMKWFTLILILTCGLLFMVACATPQPVPTEPPTETPMPTANQEPTATPVPPTETPVPKVPEWDYVAINIYIAIHNSPESMYATYLEEDLDVKVNMIGKSAFAQGNQFATTRMILDKLRSDEELRSIIREAEVITVYLSPFEIFYLVTGDYRTGRCGGDDNMACFADALPQFRESCDGIYAEILSLASPGTIVRTVTLPHGDLVLMMDYDVDLSPFYVPFNEQILQSASAHNIPVARVDIAFHGPSGDEDAMAKGLMDSNYFTVTPDGAKFIADLWRDLGYEQTVP